jgi:hypothetical protein
LTVPATPISLKGIRLSGGRESVVRILDNLQGAEARSSRIALQCIAGASVVSIESNLTPRPAEPSTVSAIENEIPSYRAISPQAVFSLICGVLAVLSFVHPVFLGCAAGAVLLGILADRKIRRMSDVLTGREIAQAGIALGLIFGLAAITTTSVQSWVRVREAAKFARSYGDVLNVGSLQEAFWYGQNPSYRQGKTPDELYAETRKAGGPSFEMGETPLNELKAHIAKEGAKLRFVKIEQHGKDKLDLFATALYELDRTATKEHPEDKEFALAILRGSNSDRKYEWWTEKLVFPYKLDTFQPAPKPVDDGHGHAH